MALPNLLFLVLLLAPRLATATCYAPDGKPEPNPEYVPCSNDASNPLHTICCATNRPPERGPDICAPNGLCQVGVKKGEEGKNKVAWTKPQCTRGEYGSLGCLHVCGSDSLGYLTPCDAAAGNSSLRWCCGFNDTSCCTRTDYESVFPLFGDALAAERNASSSSSSTTTTSSPSASPSQLSTSSTPPSSLAPASPTSTDPLATPTASPAESNSLSTPAKAGIAVGASVAGLALIAGLLALRRLRTARKTDAPPANGEGPYDASGHPRGFVTYAHEEAGSGRRTPVCELADEKGVVGAEVWSGKDPIEVA